MTERRTRVHGSTHTVGVVGWPVTLSLSPTIHNSAFIALGMDWIYVPLPVPPGLVGEALSGLRALGFAGANVTMPHKTECARLLEDLSDDAKRLQAVNTIVVGPETTSGHNTDAPGFERFLLRDAGFDPAGRSALLFGAGGAARACALALARCGLGALTVALREPSRGEVVRETLQGLDTEVSVVAFEDAGAAAAELVVNATPLGARGETLPVPPLGPGVVAVDLHYRPAVTPLLSAAREQGGASYGGLGLLLNQAALSFELWTGQAAPMDVMSAAALSELGDRGPSARG